MGYYQIVCVVKRAPYLSRKLFYLDISSPVQFSSPAMTCSVFSSWLSIIGELISLINLFRTFPSIVAYMLISWLHAFPYLISSDTYFPLRSIFPSYISYFILSQHRIITPFLWEDPELHVQYPSLSLLNLNLPCLWWQCVSCSKWVLLNPTIDCFPLFIILHSSYIVCNNVEGRHFHAIWPMPVIWIGIACLSIVMLTILFPALHDVTRPLSTCTSSLFLITSPYLLKKSNSHLSCSWGHHNILSFW